MRLIVATGNAGKLEEIALLLADEPVEVVSLAGLGPVRFPDEGEDYRANALAKARAVVAQLGEAAVADDSGLEVDALGGAPGPHSARYGGPGLDDRGRVARLLAELEGVAAERRSARFVCHVALVFPDGEALCVEGICDGRIRQRPSGASGFGYDPIFEAAGEELTMAELSAARKNAISHRARAFRRLVQTTSWLERVAT